MERLFKEIDDRKDMDKPVAVVIKSVKGKGVSFMEDQLSCTERDRIRNSTRLRWKSLKRVGETGGLWLMSEVITKATREGYGAGLLKLGEKYDNIVVMDADLASATKTGVFKAAYPDKFVNCGIAEQNMMSVAAGLSTTGKIVFASSFAMFAVGRAFEQIRNSIAYPNLNVKIGATHAGISVGEDALHISAARI